MNQNFSERGLLRTLVRASLVLFAAFLLWRFLAGIATVVLLLLTGVLLAGVLVKEPWFRRLEDGGGEKGDEQPLRRAPDP